MFAHNPLLSKNKLGNENFPLAVSFIYGDRDWMDSNGGRTIVEINKFKDTYSQVYILSNSGHHLNQDNPSELCNIIIDDLTRF